MSAPLMFRLPWPPSINRMYSQGIIGGVHKKARASMFLSQEGKQYRTAAMVSLNEQCVPKGAFSGRIAVFAAVHGPDKRIRDLDNLWKSALDVLKHNGIITDDGYIDDLHIVRGPSVPGGLFLVTLKEITEAFETRQEQLALTGGRK